MYDVAIVGGGPAGLSAALVLGRCRRRVLVCDAGKPRNAASRGLHGYLTRDGVHPRELLRLGRKEIARYGVKFRNIEVVSGRCVNRIFELRPARGAPIRAKKLLLATGVRDRLPDIPGFAEMYGRSVHHCPYCDGYEWRDQPLAVYGRGHGGVGLALKLRTWTRDIVLCTDGAARLSARDRQKLADQGIAIHHERIQRLDGRNGRLRRIVFRRGDPLPRQAIFFSHGQEPCSPALVAGLGCKFTRRAGVRTDKRERTGIPGLWVVGDASKDVQFVIVAAAEGANAAVAINEELQAEDGLHH